MLRMRGAVWEGVRMIFSLAACGQAAPSSSESTPSNESATRSEAPESQATKTSEAETSSDDGKTLVVYFYWSGNTEEMANHIAEQTGADLLEIEPSNPYPDDNTETGNVAREERDTNARPAIANLPDSIEEYDSIFIGYPIWWHTAPMKIGTFLESYDLKNKTIIPFATSGSSDMGKTNEKLAPSCPGSKLLHGKVFNASSTKADLSAWVDSLNF